MTKDRLFSNYSFSQGFTLKNRFVMAPMTTWSGTEEGYLSEEEFAYYGARSRGVGMLITATTYLRPNGRGFKGQFYGGTDAMVPQLKRLAQTIQAGGAKAVLQMFHAGRKSNPALVPEAVALAPSAVPAKREDHTPRAMTEAEIQDAIQSFYEGTKRAYQAGFDGIEIHGANTYLLQQFFSPHSNRRTDQWGGTVHQRLAFIKAIIAACHQAHQDIIAESTPIAESTTAPRPFIIGYRFSPEENSDPGITMADTKILVEALCNEPLDYLHISLGHYGQTTIRQEDSESQSASQEDNEGIILERVAQWIQGRKPLIGVGSVVSLEDAAATLNYGADLVAVGRKLMMDPNTIEKWERGETPFDTYAPSNRQERFMLEAMEDRI